MPIILFLIGSCSIFGSNIAWYCNNKADIKKHYQDSCYHAEIRKATISDSLRMIPFKAKKDKVTYGF